MNKRNCWEKKNILFFWKAKKANSQRNRATQKPKQPQNIHQWSATSPHHSSLLSGIRRGSAAVAMRPLRRIVLSSSRSSLGFGFAVAFSVSFDAWEGYFRRWPGVPRPTTTNIARTSHICRSALVYEGLPLRGLCSICFLPSAGKSSGRRAASSSSVRIVDAFCGHILIKCVSSATKGCQNCGPRLDAQRSAAQPESTHRHMPGVRCQQFELVRSHAPIALAPALRRTQALCHGHTRHHAPATAVA